MVKVAVVILNWNGRELLEKFLPSVVKYSSSHAQVFVIDNASNDNSISFLKENYPGVQLVQNPRNEGFAKGYNNGLRHIHAEYYILLNSDVEVTENWIQPVVTLMESDKKIASCQAKIRDYKNKALFEYAGAAGGFIDKYGYAFCRGRIFDSFETDTGQYDDQKEIFWATGACMFIRSESYLKAGGFDEDFYAHMEEIDLCWRLKNSGYKIMYCPQSVVYHLGGATLSKIDPHKTYLNFRNNLILFFKNHSSSYFWMKLFLRMTFDGIAAIKFFLGGQFAHFAAVLKAHWHFYFLFFQTLGKRKALKAQISSYASTAVYGKSIVFDYFIRGKKKFTELDSSAF